MNNNEQQQPKLTDEEVWLRAYLVGFECDQIRSPDECEQFADCVLRRFKNRFVKHE